MKGRKPASDEVAKAEGRHLKNPERYKHDVPAKSPEEPIKPAYFDDVASEEWDRMEAILKPASMWSSTYQIVLELYCESYSNYRRTIEQVRISGTALTGKDENGNPFIKRNPFAVEMHKYKEETLKLLTELGLTPSSRSRVHLSIGSNAEDDPVLRLLA